MISLSDVSATHMLGAALASVLRGGDVVALIGDLGVGKTTLVDACVRALGGEGAASPTFALVHEYAGCALAVWHIDLYRIERRAELAELGLEEILENPAGVSFVEWADKHDVLPATYLRLSLSHVASARGLELIGVGTRGEQLAKDLEVAFGRIAGRGTRLDSLVPNRLES
jgi:tRNA threonylcarbamoyl adenosine modification protein YjeE